MKRKLFIFIVLTVIVSGSIGCAAKSDPADSVVNYLNALVDQDADSAVALSCADWEEQAKLETDSFLSVDAVLTDVQCTTLNSDNSTAEVSCSGSIDMTYNDEVRSIDLSLRTYSMQYQTGEWLVCGYK